MTTACQPGTWFVLDGDDMIFTTGADTVKGKALRRDGRAALCVDDERPPFAFVTIEGRAEVSRDLEAMLRWATMIGGRYMGADRAEEFGRRNAVPEELLVSGQAHEDRRQDGNRRSGVGPSLSDAGIIG